jgi:trk system potassium uptake protein TrkH
MMFMGRVGPLTLALALAARSASRARIRYPEGKVLIG